MTQISKSSVLAKQMHDLMAVAQSGDVAKCLEPMAGETRQVEGLRSEGRFGDLEIMIDEPVFFGGTGLAPNPAETLMAALGASVEVTIRCYAEYLGIAVDDISVNLSGTLDNRAFFGTTDEVRAGFPEINAVVNVTHRDDDRKIEELFSIMEKCCPVLDTIRNPTTVNLSLSKKNKL